MRRFAILICLAVGMMLACGPLPGGSRDGVLAQTGVLFEAQRYDHAAALIRGYLRDHPRDATMHYNLACAYSRLGEIDRAADALLAAVKHGFRDFTALQTDPDLAQVRGHEVYEAILEAAEIARKNASTGTALSRWRAQFGETEYRYERDSDRGLAYATALDATSLADMRRTLELQYDQLMTSLFDGALNYEVLIAVPTPDDSTRLLQADNVGGAYYHATRRLVTRNIGGSLRHEFVHAIHYRHMESLGQKHPLWLQEGIACLYEDYELDENGQITFTPNRRRNIARLRAQRHLLTKWRTLFNLPAERFMRKAGHYYPEVRAIFMYLAEQDKLEEWYETYTANFASDSTGTYAFETVFGKPLKQIEREFKQWLAATEPVDPGVERGDASLGAEFSMDGANDGVLTTRVLPGSPLARAQPGRLTRGDVIVAIDDHAIRSDADLARVLALYDVGQEVRIRYRRRGKYITATAVLSAMK